MRDPIRLPTSRQSLAAGAAVAALLAAGQASALPVPGSAPATVNAGGAQPIIQVGSTDVQIDLNAQRTIIDWASFNLNSGETAQFRFDQRNWIVLNRVTSGPININGAVTAYQAANLNSPTPAITSGNVWFYSPQGVVFGAGARVDVGGMLATSAAVTESAFLDTANLNIPFTGSGSGGSVTVAGGAQFTGKGYLAFVAPIVSTAAGATVNSGDYGTAAYAAVDSYEIRFRPAFNNDLTFFTFIVPNGAAGTPHDMPLNIAGATTGANVYLMAISRAALTSVLINAPGLLVGQSSFNEYGQVTITTGRNITEGQVGLNNSTPVPGARSGLVQLGEINAAGNVNIVVTGRFGTSDLTANRIRAGQGLVIAANNITIGSGGVVSGDSNVNFGSTYIDALGTVTIPTLTARTDITIQPGDFQAGGNVDLLPFLHLGAVNSGGQINILAETLDVDSMNAVSILSSTEDTTTAGSLTGSTEVRVAATTSLSLGSVTTNGFTRLTAQNFSFNGPVSADTAVVRILTPDEAVVGGTGTDGRITNAMFQRFSVKTSLTLQAGIDGQFPVSNDLIVDDLDVDPQKVPELHLLARDTNKIVVRGTVAPSAAGVHLTVGDDAADTIWAPQSIIVTGSLGAATSTTLGGDSGSSGGGSGPATGGSGGSTGSATPGFTDVRAFDSINLFATTDVLIGSERFIDLVADTPAAEIDIGKGLPLGVAAQDDEIGRVFLVAGSLTAVAGDRIVQQNTGIFGQEAGFFLTGQEVEPDEPLLTIGKAQIADMFGALQIGEGIVTTGQQAAISSRIARLEGDTTLGAIRINGCALSIGCATFTPASQFRVESYRPVSVGASIDPPVLTPPPKVEDDDREVETVVTGAGNEEIWRREK